MATTTFPPMSVPEIEAEITLIEGRIRSTLKNIEFFNDQLNGSDAVLLYSEEEINNNPQLEAQQKEIFPATIGALDRDAAYQDYLFNTSQGPIIDPYEGERRKIDGLFADFSAVGHPAETFDEELFTGRAAVTFSIVMTNDSNSGTTTGAPPPIAGDVVVEDVVRIQNPSFDSDFVTRVTSVTPAGPEFVYEFEIPFPYTSGTYSMTRMQHSNPSSETISGLDRVDPLFDPLLPLELKNPGELFGGTGSDPANEVAEIAVELADITTLSGGP